MNDELALLAAATPLRDSEVPSTAAAAVIDVAVTVAARRRAPRRPQLRRRAVVLAAAVLVLVPGAALGDTLIARTGWFGNEAASEEDGSEWLRTNAPDFRRTAAELVPALPLPADVTWAAELDRLALQGRKEPGLVQATGVIRTLEAYARCAWLAEWATAARLGAAARATNALAVLRASSRWPATVSTDGGGVVSRIGVVNAAAARGDRAPVVEELAVNCAGFGLAGAGR
jgi:hypothetical protein